MPMRGAHNHVPTVCEQVQVGLTITVLLHRGLGHVSMPSDLHAVVKCTCNSSGEDILVVAPSFTCKWKLHSTHQWQSTELPWLTTHTDELLLCCGEQFATGRSWPKIYPKLHVHVCGNTQAVICSVHVYAPLHVVWLESGAIADHVVVGGGDCTLTHVLADQKEVVPANTDTHTQEAYVVVFHTTSHSTVNVRQSREQY